MENPFAGLRFVRSTELGETPARVHRESGIVYLNDNIWDTIPAAWQRFILLHEAGHANLKTTSEVEADNYAFEHFAGTEPMSLKNTLSVLGTYLNFSNPGHQARLQAALNRTNNFYIKKNMVNEYSNFSVNELIAQKTKEAAQKTGTSIAPVIATAKVPVVVPVVNRPSEAVIASQNIAQNAVQKGVPFWPEAITSEGRAALATADIRTLGISPPKIAQNVVIQNSAQTAAQNAFVIAKGLSNSITVNDYSTPNRRPAEALVAKGYDGSGVGWNLPKLEKANSIVNQVQAALESLNTEITESVNAEVAKVIPILKTQIPIIIKTIREFKFNGTSYLKEAVISDLEALLKCLDGNIQFVVAGFKAFIAIEAVSNRTRFIELAKGLNFTGYSDFWGLENIGSAILDGIHAVGRATGIQKILDNTVNKIPGFEDGFNQMAQDAGQLLEQAGNKMIKVMQSPAILGVLAAVPGFGTVLSVGVKALGALQGMDERQRAADATAAAIRNEAAKDNSPTANATAEALIADIYKVANNKMPIENIGQGVVAVAKVVTQPVYNPQFQFPRTNSNYGMYPIQQTTPPVSSSNGSGYGMDAIQQTTPPALNRDYNPLPLTPPPATGVNELKRDVNQTNQSNSKTSKWLWIGIAAAVVVIGAIVTIIIIKKKE